MAPQAATSESRLEGLDGLRGAAALLVLGYHLHTQFSVAPVFARSYLAVDFFFALSGYVMARTYDERLRSGQLSPLSFMLLRYRRVWAPIAAGVLIGAILQLTAGELALLTLVLNLLLAPNLGDPRPYELNRPAWSIFFELAANLVHAVILARASTRVLLAIVVASALILAVSSIPFDAVTVGLRSDNFFSGMARVMVAYGIGVALWRWRPQLAPRPWLALAALVLLLLLVPHGLGWDLAFVMLATPAIIALGAGNGGRVAAFAGALSFPLYAVHFPILQICQAVNLGPLSAAALSLIAAVAVGIAVDKRLTQAVATRLLQAKA